jgi:hypothetical protein
MRPRFSLFTLLAVTAYLAVALAGLMFPQSVWNAMIVHGWALLVAWMGIIAFSERSAKSAFAGAFVVTVLAYAAASIFDPLTPLLALSAESRPRMPHELVFRWLARQMSPATREFWDHETAYRRWALANCSLACGVLGGCLAAWRYRRIEKHAISDKRA